MVGRPAPPLRILLKLPRTSCVEIRVSEADVVAAIDRGMSPSEYLSAGPDMVDRLERGSPARHGVAVVHAAADWFRAGLSRPVPLRVVRSLYLNYLPADGSWYRRRTAL